MVDDSVASSPAIVASPLRQLAPQPSPPRVARNRVRFERPVPDRDGDGLAAAAGAAIPTRQDERAVGRDPGRLFDDREAIGSGRVALRIGLAAGDRGRRPDGDQGARRARRAGARRIRAPHAPAAARRVTTGSSTRPDPRAGGGSPSRSYRRERGRVRLLGVHDDPLDVAPPQPGQTVEHERRAEPGALERGIDGETLHEAAAPGSARSRRSRPRPGGGVGHAEAARRRGRQRLVEPGLVEPPEPVEGAAVDREHRGAVGATPAPERDRGASAGGRGGHGRAGGAARGPRTRRRGSRGPRRGRARR